MKPKIHPDIRQGYANEKCAKCRKSLHKKKAYIKPGGGILRLIGLQGVYCSVSCFNAAFNRSLI